MKLDITTEQAYEMRELLGQTLRDMSHQIAATENPEDRAKLTTRRRSLTQMAEAVDGLLVVDAGSTGTISTDAEELVRELAHPGG